MDHIIVLAELQAQEGKGDELVAAVRAALPATRAEAGNVQYEFHRDRNDPNRFMFYEIWESDEATAAHSQQPHYRTMSKAIGPLLAAPPRLTTFTRIDSAT